MLILIIYPKKPKEEVMWVGSCLFIWSTCDILFCWRFGH